MGWRTMTLELLGIKLSLRLRIVSRWVTLAIRFGMMPYENTSSGSINRWLLRNKSEYSYMNCMAVSWRPMSLHRLRIHGQSSPYRVSCLRSCGFFCLTLGKFCLLSRTQSFRRCDLPMPLPAVGWEARLHTSLRSFDIVSGLGVM